MKQPISPRDRRQSERHATAGSCRPPATDRRRPLFGIGPGLLAATVLAAVLIASGRLMTSPNGAPPDVPLRPPGRAPTHPPPFPDVATLLRRRSDLGLTPTQTQRLQALERAWQRQAAGPQAALAARSGEITGYLNGARSDQRLDVEDLRRRGAALSALSAALAAQRHQYWHRGLALLRPDQRQKLMRHK